MSASIKYGPPAVYCPRRLTTVKLRLNMKPGNLKADCSQFLF